MTRFILLLGLLALVQQRDTAVTPGTGEIAGVLMSADAQPVPIRRAVVSIASDALAAPRSTITDDAGRFTFTKLPAGAYAITAKKAAYLQAEFGASKPGRSGSKLALASGERRAVALTMFRGAAIGGTLRNLNGAPVAGVSVIAIGVKTIGQRDRTPIDPVVTNDRGEFRIYGLMPGEYLVAAAPAAGGSGEIGARPAAEMDALLAALSQRPNATTTSKAPPPAPEPSAVGYAAIYFPGTPLLSEAERIRLAPGDDRSVNFNVTRVPVASIEGIVMGDVPSPAGVLMAIVPETSPFRGGGPRPVMPVTSVPPNQDGAYKYGNLPPGRYQIVARARRGSGEPAPPPPPGSRIGGSGVPAGIPLGTGVMMYGVADVEVRGQDIKGVNITLQPGGTIAGKIVFDSTGTPAPVDFGRIRVGITLAGEAYGMNIGTTRMGNMLSDVPQVGVNSDGTFLISGVGPARYTFTVTLPPNLASTWKLRSAIVDGRDLVDAEVIGPAVAIRGVTVTLSDKRTELTGTLVSGTGQPAADHYVIAFSTDRAHWRDGSRRILSARPATDGRFVFTDLPAGEYFVAALTDLDPLEWQDAAFLEQVAPGAIKISVGEGEKKVQDLRIK